jgi:uncharacterized membrane protein
MTRKRRPVTILVFACIVLIIQVYDFDYTDLSWNMDSKNYLRILSGVLVITGVIIDNLQAKKEKNN